MKLKRLFLFFLMFGICKQLDCEDLKKESPPLTVVIVIDQFAYSHMRRLAPHLNHGFKLLQNGINFTDAHHPHGTTCTATGHAALGTGTYAKDHGIILNSWRDIKGTSQGFMDKNKKAAQFYGLDKTSLCDYGFSAKNIMVDGISDQLILGSTPEKVNRVFSISLKPRAAIGMGGRLGKAIWFDQHTVTFTSGRSFFDKLPSWLVDFNKENDITKKSNLSWEPAYDLSSDVYNFENINNYEFANKNAPRVNSTIAQASRVLDCKKINKRNKRKVPFSKSPHMNQLMLDLATKCLKKEFVPNQEKAGNFLLWVSLSPLDMVGHAYGPDCLETVDMIYHLDKQLKKFITNVQAMTGEENVLFVLTADHGVAPIPELMNRKGLENAHRILHKDILKSLNDSVFKQFEISNVVSAIKSNHIYLNKKSIAELSDEMRRKITDKLKEVLRSIPGIHDVWTGEDFEKVSFDPSQLESYFKNQYYQGRSGDLVCMLKPYSMMSKRTCGTTHGSPYKDTTHVPLIFYQEGRFEKKEIGERVFIPQVPVTIAKILGIQPPSASPFQELPGILSKKNLAD